ncbi:hypothetical protein [Hoeflea sp. 108]|jgi:hypothetical protein|uniref:hypothetical protein n=1 Tax=Hoeflea sp. 108 TaxID=1116369 RepID=UPI00036779AE|nr:hypothetical protein [Hoeflea sp. 108]
MALTDKQHNFVTGYLGGTAYGSFKSVWRSRLAGRYSEFGRFGFLVTIGLPGDASRPVAASGPRHFTGREKLIAQFNELNAQAASE